MHEFSYLQLIKMIQIKTNGKKQGNQAGQTAGEKTQQKKHQWQRLKKQSRQMYEIITGQLHFPLRPFHLSDQKPDLIIRWRMPEMPLQKPKELTDQQIQQKIAEQQLPKDPKDPTNNKENNKEKQNKPLKQTTKFIKRNLFKPVSAFVSVPTAQLEEAFSAAQAKIMKDMQQANENADNKEVQFRLFGSLKQMKKPQNNISKIIHATEQEEILQFQCLDQKLQILDGFTLDFNSVLYILQHQCGFNVRAFLVKNEERQENWILTQIGVTALMDMIGIAFKKKVVRDIYLFLNLSVQNMLKVAARFKVKKAIDYTVLDFYLNDPCSTDERPLRFNSRFITNKTFLAEMKQISRYFRIREQNATNSQIIDERDLSLKEQQQFLSYWEEITLIFHFFKNLLDHKVSNEEKVYLFEYNRGKLNEGCEKLLSRMKKAKQFYQVIKDVCRLFEFPQVDEPPFYEEFILPGKDSKGGFFQKLQSVLVFESNTGSQYGDQQLFNSMERTKLCYIMMKQKFKINYLNKLGCDIMMLNNEFEKVGRPDDEDKIKVVGGLKGTYVQDRWYYWALFSDIETIRSYFGDVVAFQIVIKTGIIFFLLIISAPTTLLFIFEQLYGQLVLLYMNLIEIGIFVVAFCVFTLYVEEQEERFATNYSDKKPSRIFLNEYRGPYVRNPMTDELNQFQEELGFIVLCKNFACILIFGILAVIFGAIFLGCRQLLIQIQPTLYGYQTKFVSLSHIISYSVYFMIGDVFKLKLYGYIVKGMIWIKNPPTDEMERAQRSYFTFYYLLTLQCIPILFFFVLEPFQGVNCFSNNCSDAFGDYIYARFLFNLAMAMLSFIQVFFLGYGKRTLEKSLNKVANVITGSKDEKAETTNTFQDKLKNMILSTIKQRQKPQYEQGLTRDILSLFAYCFYGTQFTIAGVVALLYIITIYIVMRTNLMYETRRPINKSQTIISFSKYLYAIYFCGLLFNVWSLYFLTGFTETHFIFAINLIPPPITASSLFFCKIALTFLTFLLFSALGAIVRSLTLALSPKTLVNRQRNKYKQYIRTVGGPKTKGVKFYTVEPIKTIFRIFSPDARPDEQLERELNKLNSQRYNYIIERTQLKGAQKQKKLSEKKTDKSEKKNSEASRQKIQDNDRLQVNRSEARMQMSNREL